METDTNLPPPLRRFAAPQPRCPHPSAHRSFQHNPVHGSQRPALCSDPDSVGSPPYLRMEKTQLPPRPHASPCPSTAAAQRGLKNAFNGQVGFGLNPRALVARQLRAAGRGCKGAVGQGVPAPLHVPHMWHQVPEHQGPSHIKHPSCTGPIRLRACSWGVSVDAALSHVLQRNGVPTAAPTAAADPQYRAYRGASNRTAAAPTPLPKTGG